MICRDILIFLELIFIFKKNIKVLLDAGISSETITLATKSLCDLSHYREIKSTVDFLSNPIDEKLLQEVNCYIQSIIQNAITKIQDIQLYGAFRPSFNENISMLKNFDGERAFTQEVKHSTGIFQMALETIEQQRTAVMNGQRKQDLSVDWLDTITNRVSLFLSQK